jgi:hypothetical protein
MAACVLAKRAETDPKRLPQLVACVVDRSDSDQPAAPFGIDSKGWNQVRGCRTINGCECCVAVLRRGIALDVRSDSKRPRFRKSRGCNLWYSSPHFRSIRPVPRRGGAHFPSSTLVVLCSWERRTRDGE